MNNQDLLFYGNPNYKGLIIIYRVTLKCNYGCNYCDSFDNGTKFSDKQVLDDAIKFFDSIPKDIPLELHLTGGEPTLHPYFLEFVDKLTTILKERKDTTLLILSNLSKDLNYYKKMIGYLERIDSLMFLSYHKDFIHENVFFEKADEIYKIKKEIEIGYMIENESCIENFKKINKPYKISFRPTFDLLNNSLYEEGLDTESEMSVYFENNEYKKEYKFKKQHNFLGCVCLVYSKNLFIEYNGDIHPCTSINSRDLNVNNVKYTDIKQDKIICTSGICHCEHKIPKFNMKNTKLLYDKELCKQVFGFVPGWFK